MQSTDAVTMVTSNYNGSTHPKVNYNKKILTHNVLAEYVTMTTCPYCPSASSQLNDIYNSEDYDFYYVSLVYDQNKNLTWGRLEELEVTSVPDVCFDGKFQYVEDMQSDDQPYRNVIETCVQRNVSDINLDIETSWLGNGILKISINIQNNESEKFDGHLRAYVVEPISRWNDSQDNPFRFGFLSFAFNRKISLAKQNIKSLGGTYTYTSIWVGNLYGFKDISKDNIMVIAAVFDEENDYVQQTSAAIPEHNSYGKHENNLEIFNNEINDNTELIEISINQENKNSSVYLLRDNINTLSRLGANLSYRPEFYDFGDKYEGETDSTTFEVWNSGCCYLTYSIVENCTWITVEPDYGSSIGEHDNITVEIDTANLLPGQYSYNISILSKWNNEVFNVYLQVIEKPNNPPNAPSIKGPNVGTSNTQYQYRFKTLDLDGDDIYYFIDWGDDINETIGPYYSGEEIIINHTWYEKDTYTIKAKAIDALGAESDWGLLEITMPKNKPINQIFRSLDFYPNLFLILRYLINLS